MNPETQPRRLSLPRMNWAEMSVLNSLARLLAPGSDVRGLLLSISCGPIGLQLVGEPEVLLVDRTPESGDEYLAWLDSAGRPFAISIERDLARDLVARRFAVAGTLEFGPLPLSSLEYGTVTFLLLTLLRELRPDLGPLKLIDSELTAAARRCARVRWSAESERAVGSVDVWFPIEFWGGLRSTEAGSRPRLTFPGLPLSLVLVRSTTTLDWSTVGTLESGDVVVLGPNHPADHLVLAAAGSPQALFSARHLGTELRIIEDDSMGQIDSRATDNIPLTLDVTVGSLTLPLSEVLQLGPGQVLSLAQPAEQPVVVRVQGQPVGSGELVDIDGTLGVRLLSWQPPQQNGGER